jgi:hypothetical protein
VDCNKREWLLIAEMGRGGRGGTVQVFAWRGRGSYEYPVYFLYLELFLS